MRPRRAEAARLRPPRAGRTERRRFRSRRGVVLAVVVWLLVVVVIVAMGLAYDAQLAAKATANADAKARCYYAALSGIERLAALLDGELSPTAMAGTAGTERLADSGAGSGVYTAPGQGWERLDSDEEPLWPEAEQFRYLVLAVDNCALVDLNAADETALTQVPGLTEAQIQAILQFRDAAQSAAGAAAAGEASASSGRFRSVDELLALDAFTPAELYGAAVWQERLSAAELFRRQWAQMEAGQSAAPPTSSAAPGEPATPPLVDLLTVGARARQLASDGQPRLTLATLTRSQLQERLGAIAGLEEETAGGETAPRQGAPQQRGGGSPLQAALRVVGNRNIQNWSQVWNAVGNNREAVRLLADVLTLPGSSGSEGASPAEESGPGEGPGGGSGGGPGRGGPGGGGPGGGPGRGGPGGGGPGGGGPGGGGPGGGGPGRPGGPGGPGGGGPGGGRGAGAWRLPGSVGVVPAVFEGSARLLLAQAPGPALPPPTQGAPAADSGESGLPSVPEPIEGAVNLNTASLETLLTLPGMTEEVAQAILEYRQSQPFVSRGDLLRIDAVTPQIFNQIVERVTVFSDSFTVRALGVARDPRTGGLSDLAVHLTAVLDRTSGRCRIVRLRQDH